MYVCFLERVENIVSNVEIAHTCICNFSVVAMFSKVICYKYVYMWERVKTEIYSNSQNLPDLVLSTVRSVADSLGDLAKAQKFNSFPHTTNLQKMTLKRYC